MSGHELLSGTDLHDMFQYVTSADPGAVGAGKNWLDTSLDPVLVVKRRNATNTGWNIISVSIPAGGTAGQVLKKVSASDFDFTWQNEAGGGGGGSSILDRRWVRGSTAHALDDEFTDATIDPAWISVDNTGRAGNVIWAEGADTFSVTVGNAADAGGELHAKMKAMSMAVGDYIQIYIRGIGKASNYPMAGLIISDGVTYGAGIQMVLGLFRAIGEPSTIELAYWSNFGVRSGYSDHREPYFASGIHLRLKYSAINQFSAYVSPDAVQWVLLQDYALTMTPTHVGVFGTGWGTVTPMIYAMDYFRVNAA